MDMPDLTKYGVIDQQLWKTLAPMSIAEAEDYCNRNGIGMPVKPTGPRVTAATRREIADRLQRGGFTRVGDGSVFDALVQGSIDAATAHPRRGLLFVGGPGTGKTTAARALTRSSFMLARTLSDWQSFHDFMLTGDFILDDVGTEHVVSEFGDVYNPFCDFVIAMYQLYTASRWQRPPILTTNLRSSDRNRRYGPRVESRIREMFVIVDFGVGDHRMEALNG